MSGFFGLFCLVLALTAPAFAAPGGGSAATVLFEEHFDHVAPPTLPAGWRSSAARTAGTADFATTSSSPSSLPNAVLATNATVDQWLASCPLDRRTVYPAVLSFALRRSSTFTARCVIEVSTDGGQTFPLVAGEVSAVFAVSEYQTIEMPLPAALANADSFLLRWHFLAAATGATATVRLDDVQLFRPRPTVPRGAVVINEILAQPGSGEPEWIELINTGATAVDPAGWGVCDAPTGTVHVIAAGAPPLAPGGLLVLTADSVASRASAGPQANVLQPAGFPSLNNGGDLLIVQDERGAVMDSLRYDAAWGGGAGISLERCDPAGSSVAPENWGSCRAPAGSTPGAENTIVIRPHDLRMVRVFQIREGTGASTVLTAVVRNAGSLPSSGFTVTMVTDASAHAGNDVIATVSVPGSLAKGDSVLVVCAWENARPGRTRVRAVIGWQEDQRPENDTASCDVIVSVSAGALRINEIQATPLNSSAEFIEIINIAAVPVSIEGCFLADRHLQVAQMRRWVVADHPVALAAGRLHVVAGDSSVLGAAGLPEGTCSVVARSGLGLNNDADTVLLYSADSLLIDSVVYHASWHSGTVPDPAGRSLERYRPELPGGDARSWGTCVDPSGATPGRPNSILLSGTVADASLTCTPDPFSPDADGHDDATVVRYRLPVRSSLCRIRVYDIRGRCVRDLVNAAPVGMTGDVVWDGLGDGRVPLRIGIYIIHLEAIDEEGGRTLEAKCGVVLARRL